MKTKYAVVIIFFILVDVSYSKDYSVINNSFPENTGVYLFGDDVRVRKDAEVNEGNITDILNIGQKVKIQQKTDRVMIVNGYKQYWYRVSYKKNSKESSGYIWGGLFSFGYSAKGNKLFLAGITKYNVKLSEFSAECRLVENGKVLSTVGFSPHSISFTDNDEFYEYDITSGLMDGQGLEGLENTFKINFNFSACGYPYGNVWIGYGNNTLYYIGKDTSISEAGVFHVEEKFIFPGKNKGAENNIVLVSESFDFDDNLNDYKLREKKETRFEWKNKKIIEKK